MALLELPMRPDVQPVVGIYGNVHDAGEDQGFPLIAHQRVADFGVAGIPEARIVEEILRGAINQYQQGHKVLTVNPIMIRLIFVIQT